MGKNTSRGASLVEEIYRHHRYNSQTFFGTKKVPFIITYHSLVNMSRIIVVDIYVHDDEQ
jgi:hypothetical protein